MNQGTPNTNQSETHSTAKLLNCHLYGTIFGVNRIFRMTLPVQPTMNLCCLYSPTCVYTCIYTVYRGADKSLARPTSKFVLFDGYNISIDASLVIYINSTNIPPVVIINRAYETQNLVS
jgi:hypothetical protein